MKDIVLFLKSKRFRYHFILSLVAGGFILWVSFKGLSIYTNHGETFPVPDFSTLKIEDLSKFIADKSLKYEIIDSVFDSKATPGTVIKQDPEKNTQVKKNRIIYLTVCSKLPPLIKMPNLVDASMRQALALLESNNLIAGKRSYRPDPCVNCVLAQSFKGKNIEPGAMVPKGSVIDLVLGQGQDGKKLNIPCVTGLTRKEASDKIAESGFSEGSVVCHDCKTNADKEKAKVVKQNPACSQDILFSPGSPIDLFLSTKTVITAADTTADGE